MLDPGSGINESGSETDIYLGMSRAEMILKVVMTPPDPPAVFVEHYIRLVPGNAPFLKSPPPPLSVR